MKKTNKKGKKQLMYTIHGRTCLLFFIQKQNKQSNKKIEYKRKIQT